METGAPWYGRDPRFAPETSKFMSLIYEILTNLEDFKGIAINFDLLFPEVKH